MSLELSWMLIAIVAAYLASGTVKGALGLGLPTTAISLSSLAVSPKLAVALVVIPILVTNVWQIYRQGEFGRILRTYWLYAICIWVSLWLSSQFAPQVSTEAVSLLMGVGVLAFVFISFLNQLPPIPAQLEKPIQAVIGTSAGMMGGIAAIWSPPVALYLLSKRFEREEFVRVSGFLLGAGGFPLSIGYLTNGLMPGDIPLISAILVVPTLVGFTLGERVRKHLTGDRFRKALLIFFFILGLNMLRKGFGL